MAGNQDQWWLDDRETAELIWCAAHLHRIFAPPSSEKDKKKEKEKVDLSFGADSSSNDFSKDTVNNPPSDIEEIEQPTNISTYPKNSGQASTNSEQKESSSEERASPVSVPDPFPLPNPADIGKALLPLAKRVPGIWANELDIEATVEKSAEANGLPTIAFRPPLERWFEVHLLVDRSPSMAFWDDLAEGVAKLFRWQGFFRDVRVWQLETGTSKPRLFSGTERIEREIGSLIAPNRNRLFIVLTDTLGKAWRSGAAFADLALLGQKHPVTIAHIFPQYLWSRTALSQAIQRPLVAPLPGCANSILKRGGRKLRTKGDIYQFPILNLLPNHFATWANFLAGGGESFIQGVLIKQQDSSSLQLEVAKSEQKEDRREILEESAEDLLQGFLLDASQKARELARILAAVPLIPPVMRLAQRRFLKDSEYWHLAEVFFSGLLQRSSLGSEEASVTETWYEFRPKIRELLLETSSVGRTTEIWRELGSFIQERYGSLRDFQALIPNPTGSIQDMVTDRELYFAEVNAAVFMTWGGEYAIHAQELRKQVEVRKQKKKDIGDKSSYEQDETNWEGFPPLQDTEYESSTIVLLDGIELQTQQFEVAEFAIEDQPIFQTFEFITAKLEQKQKSSRNESTTEWVIREQTREAQKLVESLSKTVTLEMVLIPPGEFMMGAASGEEGSSGNDLPQHKVTIAEAFLMGRYPVTQEQWQAVAALPKVNRELESEPSRFKGNNRPVEQVSWEEAKEFCDRLTQNTNREYRLPTEAEWEYACRAGTKTPFHYGETITTELANYNGDYIYGAGVKGKYRRNTTEVGQFPPNAFGLYDMHGNIWEWCEDDWHENYEGAPTDGSAWLSGKGSLKVIRGGSWDDDPESCRSATRYVNTRDLRDFNIGFRVVCVVPRTT